MRFYLTTIFLTLAVVGVPCFDANPLATADDWDQWRGPTRDAHLASDQPWPDSLDESHLKQIWRVPLGPSYSGPIIVGQQVFVTETRKKRDEVVRALDRATGDENWNTEWPGSMTVPFFASENGSWIRSTPASDGQRLYVAGMRDVLVCLDIKSGDELWRVDFVKEFSAALPGFGTVCSPLLDDEFVYIQASASVVKLRKDNGSIVWRSKPESGGLFGAGMGASPFSSPVIETIAGTRQIVAQSRKQLAGFDLETGDKLWSVDVPAFRGMNILTPLVIGDTVFTSTYGGGSFLFDVKRLDDQFTVSESWQTKQQGYMSSPVKIADHIYLHLRNQRLTCINPADGSTAWTGKPMGKYWSMIAQGDRILALDHDGELRLIDANPQEYREIDSRRVSESTTWAHVAISDNQVFIRELDAISAWTWK